MLSFKTKVKSLFLSQPDAVTCQSACIAMATNDPDVLSVRNRLLNSGEAGDPYNMGRVLSDRLGSLYEFDENASLSEICDWLKNGELLITHGWFTRSGHVIVLDGVQIDPTNLSYRLDVRDPWSEFDFRSWSYNNPSVQKFDGFYSSYGIYAACVVGQSASDSARIYRRGELDSQRKGAWVHRIKAV